MKRILTVISFAILMVACGESKKAKNPQLEARETISTLEKLLLDAGDGFNDSAATQITKAYLRYAEAYPTDSISPDYMFKAADVMRGQFRWNDAVTVLEALVKKYPKDPRVPSALFFAGFMLHNDLNQNEKARPYLERLIAEHPDHPMSADARMLLETMHMSPEELIEHLEKKNGVTQ